MENATTKEELTARNGMFKRPCLDDIHYVEIVRNPAGANANMREWIKKRGYYEKKFDDRDDEYTNEAIWIDHPTIG